MRGTGTQATFLAGTEITSTDGWPLRTYLELAALPTAVPCARLHAKNVLHEWHLGSLADTVELLISEIVTNAVRASATVAQHGIGVPTTKVWLTSDGRRVLIQRAYGGTISDDFGIYQALEDAACALAVYAPGPVPGLLRTEPYARTLITSTGTGLDGEAVGQLVHDCLARRVLLTRARSPSMITLALDEAVVRRPVSGTAVMAGQLRFLADMAVLPNVCLRVVPYAAGLHPGLITGGFTLLHFLPSKRDSDNNGAVVYTSGLTGELYLDKPHGVAPL